MSCDVRSCGELSSVVPCNGMECYEVKPPLFSKQLNNYSVLQSTTPVLLQHYSVLQSTTPVLLCTTPVLLRTTKYYSSTTTYYSVLQSTTPVLQSTYKLLLQYYSVLQSTTAVLLCTTKCYSSITLYYKVLLQYYSVLQSTTAVLQSITLYYKVLLQYYSVLQSTTPVLLCTTKYYSSTTLYYKVLLPYYFAMSFTMRVAKRVTLQLHQILHLPRKMNLMIDPPHIWKVIYNARSSKSHPATSPNTAPATQNECHDWSLARMKRHLQCAEQQASPSHLTKYCACHAKWMSWLIVLTYETSFPLRRAARVTLQLHQILRLPRKMNVVIDRAHIWNVIYNARSDRHHPATSPNTAPATQNCTPKS